MFTLLRLADENFQNKIIEVTNTKLHVNFNLTSLCRVKLN